MTDKQIIALQEPKNGCIPYKPHQVVDKWDFDLLNKKYEDAICKNQLGTELIQYYKFINTRLENRLLQIREVLKKLEEKKDVSENTKNIMMHILKISEGFYDR